jgi:hypothetical protein
MTTKNKAKIIKKINDYFYDYNLYQMPDFNKSTDKSIFFKKNYKKIIKLFEKKNRTVQETKILNELILCSYFSSTVVINSIKNIEKSESKINSVKLNNLFDRNKKKNYLKI